MSQLDLSAYKTEISRLEDQRQEAIANALEAALCHLLVWPITKSSQERMREKLYIAAGELR